MKSDSGKVFQGLNLLSGTVHPPFPPKERFLPGVVDDRGVVVTIVDVNEVVVAVGSVVVYSARNGVVCRMCFRKEYAVLGSK